MNITSIKTLIKRFSSWFFTAIMQSINILIRPTFEAKQILSKDIDSGLVIRDYILPHMILLSISVFIGNCISYWFLHNVTLEYSLISALLAFINVVPGIYLTVAILKKVIRYKKFNYNQRNLWKLVSYSLAPSFLFFSLANIIKPWLYYITIYNVISIVIYWLYCPLFIDIPTNKKLFFRFITSIILASIFMMMYVISESVLSNFFLKSDILIK